MKILVFVKQIPDISKVKRDPATNRIVREGVPLQINSFDKKAIEEAVRIKERSGAEVIAASMGPPSATEVLITCLKFGADSSYLISDRRLGGSDTLITSMALSAFAKKIKPDLILCGKYSLDGETSQVPPEIAVFLQYNFKSSVSRIDFNENRVTVTQDMETGFLTSGTSLPLVVSVSEKINKARFIRPGGPDLSGKITTVDMDFLGISLNGIQDSPTVVYGTENVESRRNNVFIDDPDEFISKILAEKGNSTPVEETVEINGIEDLPENAGEAWIIALDNPRTVKEISSRVAELSGRKRKLKIIGNLEADEIKGCSAHEYIKLDTNSISSIAGYLVENILTEKPEFVIFPSTVNGRDIASFVAAKLKLGLTADCVDLKMEDGKLIQYKPAFGGGVLAKIYSKTQPALATVRPGIFKAKNCRNKIEVTEVKLKNEPDMQFEGIPETFLPLNDRQVVLGIGKGIISKENVPRALELADLLDASIGGTRPIVDLGWLPRQQQIGLTGASISPAVYIALGISGHDNHVVGIRYAGKVFAVNKDRNAPIFLYSDYGYVGDSMDFLERFIQTLGKSNN